MECRRTPGRPKVFASAANDGYEDLSRRLIVAVDGVPPRNLADLVRLVESGSGEFVRFTDIEGQEIVLDRRLAADEGPAILSRYQLAADRSAELSPRDYLRGRAATVPSYVDATRPTSSMPPVTTAAGDVGRESGARTNSLSSTP